MKIVRFVAGFREGDQLYADHRITMIVGLDDTDMIAPGEWVGYAKTTTGVTPFVVRTEDNLLITSEYDTSLSTTVARRVIRVGEMFALGSMPGESPKWESVFQIATIHAYC